MATAIDEKLLQASANGDEKAIESCLKAGADIHARDKAGRTPLHLAALNNHLTAAKQLLAHKSKPDLNAQMSDEGTPLHDAVASGHDQMVDFLLKAGANPLLTDECDLNLLHWAVSENKISTARLLIARVPQLINMAKFNGITPLYLTVSAEMARLLIANRAIVEPPLIGENHIGQSPLHYVTESGCFEAVKVLVRHGARITAKDKHGQNSIDIARENDHNEIARFLEARIIHRQERTQAKFFDYKRSKKGQTSQLQKEYLRFRRTADQKESPIKANNIPSRRLVMADAGALAESLKGIDAKHSTKQGIALHAKWYNGGYKKSREFNQDWSREYIHYQLDVDPGSRKKTAEAEEVTVCAQYKPERGHLGNIYVSGIGLYGIGGKDRILHVINQTTDEKPANEKKMARLLLDYARSGQPITTTAIKARGLRCFALKKDRVQQLGYLNRICYLTAVKEVTRRMHPGLRSDATVVEELPMGIAYSMSLRLIADGYLRMQDVFSDNAPYGLPTSASISSEREMVLVKNKLIKLNDLFYSTYPNLDSSREGMHQLLRRDYGGASDTSGDEYETSDDELQDEKAVRPRIAPRF
jgi:ankyrin repeat protein